jgi:hypothetical protein
MVNFSYVIRQESGNEKMGIINLQAHFHGIKYLKSILFYSKNITIGESEEVKKIAYSFYFFKQPTLTPYIGTELGIAGNTEIGEDKVFNEQGLYLSYFF